MKRRSILILLMLCAAVSAQDVEVWQPAGSESAKEYDVPANAISGLRSYNECQWRPREVVPFAVLKAEDESGKPFWGIMIYTGSTKRDITIERYAAGAIGPTYHVLHVGGEPGPNPPPPVPPDPNLTGIAKDIYDSAIKEVSPEMRTRDATKLAGIYGGVASAIAAGGITKPEHAESALRDAFANTSHRFSPQWKPVIADINQNLSTIDSLTRANIVFTAVAAGLEAAR